MHDNQVAVLLEDIQGKLQSLTESVSILARDMTEVKATIHVIPEMIDDMRAIKLVIRDYEGQLQDHKQRINKLEMPARA